MGVEFNLDDNMHPMTNKKRFSFNHNWVMENDYKDILKQSWNLANKSSDIHITLDEVLNHISKWASSGVGSLSSRVRKLRTRLNLMRRRAEEGRLVGDIGLLEQELEKLSYNVEVYWKQRSRVNWLKAGDRNTTYFHNSTSARRKRNYIHGLVDDHYNFQTNQFVLEDIVTNFYDELFSSQQPDIRDVLKVTDLLPQNNSHNFLDPISTLFTNDEIRIALFDLNPSKAPGPNGLTALFFQNVWEIMGDDLSSAILGVLNNEQSLKKWNETIIILIPKTKDPTDIRQFRPISLCNVKYKIMARAITNRLKGFIDQLVDLNQSAFILG